MKPRSPTKSQTHPVRTLKPSGGGAGRAILAFSVALAACGDDGGAVSSGTTSSGGAGGAGDGGTAATTTSSSGDGGAATTGASSSNASSGEGSGTGGSGGTVGAGTGGGDGSGGAEAFSMIDDLRGSTVGLMTGGSLGDDGWTVEGVSDRIIYELPRLVSGSFEFTVTGITLDNLPYRDHEIFAMYEGGYEIEEPVGYNPEFRNNHYKVMIRVYGQQEEGRVGQQKIMWGICPDGAPGYNVDGPCVCPTSFFEEPFGGDGTWDGTPQTLRVEWGDGVTRYLRNGVETLVIEWGGSGLEFAPSELHASLGTSRSLEVGDASMPIGAVFSDVVIQGVIGEEVQTCPP